MRGVEVAAALTSEEGESDECRVVGRSARQCLSCHCQCHCHATVGCAESAGRRRSVNLSVAVVVNATLPIGSR